MKSLKGYICENIKANDLESLYIDFCKKYKINEDEFQQLFYVIHSDEHLGNDVKRLISKMVSKNGELPSCVLYRGCSKKEFDSIVRTGKSPVLAMSFSEDKEVASEFGECMIEVESRKPMFCYHRFIREYYESMKDIDEEAFEMEDGETQIVLADKELEWICTNDYKMVYDGNKFIIE